MTRVTIALRADAFENALQDAELRKFPYVISLGLNRLANLAQKAQRAGMQQRLTLRHSAWNLNAIKINKTDRATKTKWSVTIFLDPRADYLKRMEDEGIHAPFGGRNWLWIPEKAVFRNRIIAAGSALSPRNLHLRKVGGKIIGRQRTFMVPGPKGPIVIQRIGSGSGTHFTNRSISGLSLDNFGKKRGGKLQKDKTRGTQVLYHLRERVRVPLKLEFIDTITHAVNQNAAPVMREALAYANGRGRR